MSNKTESHTVSCWAHPHHFFTCDACNKLMKSNTYNRSALMRQRRGTGRKGKNRDKCRILSQGEFGKRFGVAMHMKSGCMLSWRTDESPLSSLACFFLCAGQACSPSTVAGTAVYTLSFPVQTCTPPIF